MNGQNIFERQKVADNSSTEIEVRTPENQLQGIMSLNKSTTDVQGNEATRPVSKNNQIQNDQFQNMFKINKNLFSKTDQLMRQFGALNGVSKTPEKVKPRGNYPASKRSNSKFMGSSFRNNLARFNQLQRRDQQLNQQENEVKQQKQILRQEMKLCKKNLQNYVDIYLQRPDRTNTIVKGIKQNLQQQQQQLQEIVDTSKNNSKSPVQNLEQNKQQGAQTSDKRVTPEIPKILSFEDQQQQKNKQKQIDNKQLQKNKETQKFGSKREKHNSFKPEEFENTINKIAEEYLMNGLENNAKWKELSAQYKKAKNERQRAVEKCVPHYVTQLQQLNINNIGIPENLQDTNQLKQNNNISSGTQKEGGVFSENGISNQSQLSNQTEVRIVSDEMESLYQDMTGNAGDPEENIRFHAGSNIQLRRKNLRTLAPQGWLDDEIINIFMGIFQERSKQEFSKNSNNLRCHLFNSFFLNRLFRDQGYNFSNVQRWTAPRKLKKCGYESVLDIDRIIFPVHLGNHWTCAMIDLKNKQIEYFDSLNGSDQGTLGALRRWIKDEFQHKKQVEIDENDFEIIQRKQIPRQQNGFDCGVFTIIFADYLSVNKVFDFEQKDMEFFRRKLVQDLMTQIQTVEQPQ